jgi:hypothetical protein
MNCWLARDNNDELILNGGISVRVSGFVVGGLLGAAAAMYFNRGNRMLNIGSLATAGQALDRFVDSARSRMMNPDTRSYSGMNSSTMSTSASSGMNSTSSSGGIAQVEKIVSEDPHLASQVNEIMSDSKDTVTIR